MGIQVHSRLGGVYMALLFALGGSVRGARVVVQGTGSVGGPLACLLIDGGAMVVASDTNRQALESLPNEVRVVDPGEVTAVPARSLPRVARLASWIRGSPGRSPVR